MKPTNLIAVIPARGGSKGIPGKNIIPVAGKPLIAYTIEAALKAESIERVFVSTDDAQIANVARQFGADIIDRPAELSGDAASSESALLHALETIEDMPEHFVFLQCTSPLTLPKDIDSTVQALVDRKADTAFTATRFHGFVWKQNEKNAFGVNHDKCVRVRRQDKEPEFLENGAVYVMNTRGFLQNKHRFFGTTAIYEMPSERAPEIDGPADLLVVAERLRAQNQLGTRIRGQNIEALVLDFDGVMTNNKVFVDENGTESVRCCRSDGMGIGLLKAAAPIKLAVMSKEQNPVVAARCAKLQLDCMHGVDAKLDVLKAWCDKNSIPLDRVLFVGNDANDIECLQAAGLSAAPADAHSTARDAAQIILRHNGGGGAVREVCDALMNVYGS